ncbi:MAG: hypothetical protein R3313_01845 [Candidatus Saccharimonadales bacterium]|nr:hypothetical protein [Candidatus Saccharimonadales bacterium]
MVIDQKTKDFIQTRLANGELPSSIVDRLKAGGWTEQQANAAVQSVSGVQLATQGSINSTYVKRPLSVFILFLLTIPILLGGILLIWAGIVLFLFGGIILIIEGAIFIYIFVLGKRIKNGNLSALRRLTQISVLSFILAIWYFNGQTSTDNIFQAVFYALAGHSLEFLLLAYIWTRHRAYFS